MSKLALFKRGVVLLLGCLAIRPGGIADSLVLSECLLDNPGNEWSKTTADEDDLFLPHRM